MAREITIMATPSSTGCATTPTATTRPAASLYDAEHGDLPGFSSLQRRGWTWNRLIAAAGLLPPEKGRLPVRPGAQFLRANPGMAPASGRAKKSRKCACAPSFRAQKLAALRYPDKATAGRLRPDGTPARCTCHYFSLR